MHIDSCEDLFNSHFTEKYELVDCFLNVILRVFQTCALILLGEKESFHMFFNTINTSHHSLDVHSRN